MIRCHVISNNYTRRMQTADLRTTDDMARITVNSNGLPLPLSNMTTCDGHGRSRRGYVEIRRHKSRLAADALFRGVGLITGDQSPFPLDFGPNL